MDIRIFCGFATFIILVLVYLHTQQGSSSTGIGPKLVTTYECVKESIVAERVKHTDAQDPNKTISLTYIGAKKNADERMQKASQLTGEINEKEAIQASEKVENELDQDAEGRRQEIFQDQSQHDSIRPKAFKAKSVEKGLIPVAVVADPVQAKDTVVRLKAELPRKYAMCSSSSEDEGNLLWMMPREGSSSSREEDDAEQAKKELKPVGEKMERAAEDEGEKHRQAKNELKPIKRKMERSNEEKDWKKSKSEGRHKHRHSKDDQDRRREKKESRNRG